MEWKARDVLWEEKEVDFNTVETNQYRFFSGLWWVGKFGDKMEAFC